MHTHMDPHMYLFLLVPCSCLQIKNKKGLGHRTISRRMRTQVDDIKPILIKGHSHIHLPPAIVLLQ